MTLTTVSKFKPMLASDCGAAIVGAVITTPNPRVVNVLACDPTHVSVVTQQQLEALGWKVSQESFFSEQHNPGQLDTLLAWWTNGNGTNK